ncbi:hypothetical protein TUM4438_04720 [Shewanella sairae]|uniref:Uncharacterized protein n=1 Tax=Shewanella sairae TaxID=190310 RepID=A0ABQ4P136_9GAMM|nr:hypothetical protein TUM4438_04720 [Shewanella sairae]
MILQSPESEWLAYTNQYKHLVTQREFSGFEAKGIKRSSVTAPALPYLLYPYSRALMTFAASMQLATSEGHS